MSTEPKDQELRHSLRALSRPTRQDFRYPIEAYEDDLVALITKRETLARIDEHHESFNDFCRAFKTDDVWNEHTEYFNKRDSELKKGLDTNHE